MRWIIIIVFLCGHPLWEGCRVNENSKMQVAHDSERVLNVVRPQTFIGDNFGDKFEVDSAKSSLTVAAINDENGVIIMNNDKGVRFKYELITASKHGMNFSIGLNSQPMTLEETIELSKAVCDIVGISDARLTEWFSSRGYEDVVEASCLQTGRSGEIDHSVEVRRSYESASPWRVVYEVTFEDTPGSTASQIGME